MATHVAPPQHIGVQALASIAHAAAHRSQARSQGRSRASTQAAPVAPKTGRRPNRQGSAKGRPPPNETRSEFTFPEWDEDVQAAVGAAMAPPVFVANPNEHGATARKDTFLLASFVCHNRACDESGTPRGKPCGNRWTSGHVGIFIMQFSVHGYAAVVYNQRCMRCNGLGTMSVDKESYVRRVAYRLQTWAGVPVEPAVYDHKRTEKEHEAAFCEGCKAGHCSKTYWP